MGQLVGSYQDKLLETTTTRVASGVLGIILRDGRTVGAARRHHHHRHFSQRPDPLRRAAISRGTIRRTGRGFAGRSPQASSACADAGSRPEHRHASTAAPSTGRSFKIQPGDADPTPFSFRTRRVAHHDSQVPCYIAWTTPETQRIIRENVHRSPMYSGQIHSVGPRYCPSIEDKIVKFPDKTTHQLFLEPEGLNTHEIYVNGMSTSLPVEVQLEILKSIPGLENADMLRPGYAIEYDAIDPTELSARWKPRRSPACFSADKSMAPADTKKPPARA